MNKNKLNYVIILLLIPSAIAAGVVIFKDRNYHMISMMIALLASVPIFITFEKGEDQTRKMVILAVMTAISITGRFIFAALPGFKPVTAIVVITAIYFGRNAGFLVGALSAILSNIFFGQGPWTPFQMFSWGMIGFIAGSPFMQKWLTSSKAALALYGVFAGIIFSLMMDIWTVLAMDGTYQASRYLAAVITSLPFMAIYAISNVIFLLLAIKPIGEKLARIKIKYGI